MERSERIERMFAPYGFDIARTFFDAFEIYHFVDQYARVKKGSCIRIRGANNRDYGFDDENTICFQIEKENPYHGPDCYIVTFRNTEEELINKFARFIKMKVFL